MSAEKVQTSDVSVVKKWLAQHPKRAVSLGLRAKDADGLVVELGSWDVKELPPERAHELVEAVEQFAQVHERDSMAAVVWTDAKDKVLQTRNLRRKYRPLEEEEEPSMSGSPMDQAAQAQRTMERMANLFMSGMQKAMETNNRLASSAIDMMQKVMESTSQDRERIEELRDQIQEIVVVQAEIAKQDADAAAAELEEQEKEKPPTVLELAVQAAVPMLMQGAIQVAPKPPAGGAAPNGAS